MKSTRVLFVMAFLFIGGFWFLAGPALAAAEEEAAVREAIRLRVERLRSGTGWSVGESPLASKVTLPRFYEARAFAPAWTSEPRRGQMQAAIESVDLEGLDPRDYHHDQIVARLKGYSRQSPGKRADLDILLTDALIRFRHHLSRGKVSPISLEPTWNLGGARGEEDPVIALEKILGADDLVESLEGLRPAGPYYIGLRRALADYRQIAEAGGWQTVPEIQKLEEGAIDERVPAIRARLAATGDLPAADDLGAAGDPGATASPASDAFDAELAEAVRRFQRRHGLNDDGVVGPRTLEAMNVPVETRLEQIRINLERGRWILHDLEEDFVAVNIAGYWVYVVEDRKPIWTSRVVVGKAQHKSPVFKADLRYLVLNPTWTVPASIARQETIPNLRRSPTYLADNKMQVLDRAGNPVDAAGLDLSSGAPFPYVFRQLPGPKNALGRVKFIFPNEHAIYLHDTPSRDLFAREVRTFSHGCIRVEDPLALAEVLLRKQAGWDRAKIDAVLATGQTTTVHLDEPLPVLILYWTAWVNREGELRFYDDVYARDGAVLEALAQPFEVDL